MTDQAVKASVRHGNRCGPVTGKKRNIEMSWIENDDGSIYPDDENNDEFYYLCQDVYSKSGGEEEICTELRTGSISEYSGS